MLRTRMRPFIKKKMKKINICKNCSHFPQGYFEARCGAADKTVTRSSIGCPLFENNIKKTDMNEEVKKIQLHYAANKLGMTSTELREECKALGIELLQLYKGTRHSRAAISSEDYVRLKEKFKDRMKEAVKERIAKADKKSLDTFSDQQLADELRSRGYELSCSKTITTTITL